MSTVEQKMTEEQLQQHIYNLERKQVGLLNMINCGAGEPSDLPALAKVESDLETAKVQFRAEFKEDPQTKIRKR